MCVVFMPRNKLNERILKVGLRKWGLGLMFGRMLNDGVCFIYCGFGVEDNLFIMFDL